MFVKHPKPPKTPSFVCQFPLLPASPQDAAAYRVEADHYRRLQNAVLSQLLRQLDAMRKDPAWAAGRLLPLEEKAAHYQALSRQYGLDKTGVGRMTKSIRRNPDFKRHTNSAVAQKLGERALDAVLKKQFGKSKRVRFKNRGEIVTLESKANASGIRVRFGDNPTVKTSRATFRIPVDPQCPYQRHAIGHRIKNSRIVVRTIKGQPRYILHLVLDGLPYVDPVKRVKHLQAVLAREGDDYFEREAALPVELRQRTGLDSGPRRWAVSTALTAFETPLCDGVDKKQATVRCLQRKMDRSLRAMNRDNYDDQGRAKKGKVWKKSAGYLKTQEKLCELERRKAAHRRSAHGHLANRVLAYGNRTHVENCSKTAWQKRYGKSIQHHAPSALECEIIRKAATLGGGGMKIDTWKTALSQHCVCGRRQKKPLAERYHRCPACGFGMEVPAPRDTLSAYLAVFVTEAMMKSGEYDMQSVTSKALQYVSAHRTLCNCIPRRFERSVSSPPLAQAGGWTMSHPTDCRTDSSEGLSSDLELAFVTEGPEAERFTIA